MESRKEFFEKLAGEWDDQQPANRIAHLHQLVKIIEPQLADCKRTLILGSGTGVLTSILEQHSQGIEIVSIDIAFSMLYKNRNLAASALLVQADVHELPFSSHSVDGIICHNSFPHFQSHPRAMREMVRLLEVESFLFILHDISRDQVNAKHRNAASHVIHHDMLPEPERMAGLMKICGLRNIQISEGEDHFLAIGQK